MTRAAVATATEGWAGDYINGENLKVKNVAKDIRFGNVDY
jgi:hypothetical protein